MKLLLTWLTINIIGQNIFAQTSIVPKIIYKPIVYNQQRINLSIEYLKIRHGLTQTTPTIIPKIIVLHYTAGGTITSNFNYFNKVEIEAARKANKDQSTLNVSSHFLVDRDGTIYQLMPDNYFARHTIGLNYCAIGIENIGSNTQPLTALQVIANSGLVQLLKAKYNIEYLELKKLNKSTAANICQQYLKDKQIAISDMDMSKLCDQSLSYYEIVDNIDFIFLSQDHRKAYQSLFKEQKTPLFIRGFSCKSLSSTQFAHVMQSFLRLLKLKPLINNGVFCSLNKLW